MADEDDDDDDDERFSTIFVEESADLDTERVTIVSVFTLVIVTLGIFRRRPLFSVVRRCVEARGD